MSKRKLLNALKDWKRNIIHLRDLLRVVDAYSSAQIAPNPCYTALELLAQMLNKEQEAVDRLGGYAVKTGHVKNVESIQRVMQMIKERQVNAVERWTALCQCRNLKN